MAWLAAWFLDHGQGSPEASFETLWRHWDARHLLTIAERGYTAPQSDPNAAAFFPLFPLAVRLVATLGFSTVAAAFVVNTVASGVAFYFLHRLVADEADPATADRAVAYLAIFPTAVFLVAPYSEALFLAGATASFFFLRRARPLAAGAACAVAVGARAAGLFLLAGLIVEGLARVRGSRREAMRVAGMALVAVLPLLAFMVFLGATFDDPFAFVEAQREGWRRELAGPIDAFMTTWRTQFSADYPTNWIMAWRVELVAAAIGCASVILMVRAGRWGYGVFCGTLLATLLVSSWYYSIPRMLLSMFPVVIVMALWTRGRPAVHTGVVAISSALCALGTIAYTRGSWFF